MVNVARLHLSTLRGDTPLPKIPPSLIELVKAFGPLVPVGVRPSHDQSYEIVFNVDIWLAAQRAGQFEVSIVVHSHLTDEDVHQIFSANDRCDPITEAEGFRRELTSRGYPPRHGDITKLSQRIGRSQSYVAHALRLLDLPERVQTAIRIGALKAGHGKALLSLHDAETRSRVATDILNHHWSVRRTERTVRDLLRGSATVPTSKDPNTVKLENELTDLVGSPVEIDQKAHELRIHYGGSLDVLQGLLHRLGYRTDD